jgi:hypothetical protein
MSAVAGIVSRDLTWAIRCLTGLTREKGRTETRPASIIGGDAVLDSMNMLFPVLHLSNVTINAINNQM